MSGGYNVNIIHNSSFIIKNCEIASVWKRLTFFLELRFGKMTNNKKNGSFITKNPPFRTPVWQYALFLVTLRTIYTN